MKQLILYHGSINIINKPIFGYGKKNNDYGLGFYCTENIELAKEWACTESNDNTYVNKYNIDIENLKILYLNSPDYSILHWITLLIKNRQFITNSRISRRAKTFLLNNYDIETTNYDIIIGYRADDSYFSFAKDFLNNTISINQLSNAMKLGNLGNQVVLISKKAFDSISFVGAEPVNKSIYYGKRKERDFSVRRQYFNDDNDDNNPTYISDIISEETNND